ncbi:DUF3379 family protein [Oceanisphaera sp.]|uniref:DUF3379 family protein n=1 Tax=Oceanisphaera sp. TaxID=1929979 RepID=UPI003A8CAF63
MNELEFRRRAYADPNDKSADFMQTSDSCAGNQQFVNELKRFDQRLEKALQEPVPDTLLNKLLLEQLPYQPVTPSGLGWRHLAVAASVTFLLGFSTRFLPLDVGPQAPYPAVGQVAIEHVRLEAPFTQTVDEQVTLTAVNAKLKPYGAQLNSLADVGKVYYANHCQFAGGPAAHLVIQGQHDRVNVFLVPVDRALQLASHFSDEQYHGEVIGMNLNRLVVVSDNQEDVKAMVNKIETSLQRAL